ncbi:MAG: ribonuclease H-like domain-containing protein [Tissierellia bacterium]|nr:ribonuclease H-like domain-containing protein [Tissierellia bacterium]
MIEEKLKFNVKNLKKNQMVLDIETTGLHRSNDRLVLLGMIYYERDSFYIHQIFAENDKEEIKLLKFYREISKDKILITYNGEVFDIIFLNNRLRYYNIEPDYFIENIDLYKKVHEYLKFFDFSSMKLKYIEKLVGINRKEPNRKDTFSILNDEKTIRENPKPIIIHNRNDLIATDALINIDDVLDDKLSFYSENLKTKITLKDVLIDKNTIYFIYNAKDNLLNSFYEYEDYSIRINNKKITIKSKAFYGKIAHNSYGYVIKNIFNIKDDENLNIDCRFLVVKDKNIFNYKNINSFARKILN